MKINDIPEHRPTARVPKQFIRIMKLTAIIITFCLIQVSAATKAQITLNEKKAPLQKVLESISTQSGYDFIYSTQDLKDLKTGTIRLNNVPIETALQAAFDGQPLQYEIADKTVMVKRKTDKTLLDKIEATISSIDVHGKVVDENGDPLIGGTVQVKGGNNAVATDEHGEFILPNVDEGAILQVSFIGYLTKEIKAQKNLGTIALIVNQSNLNAVQIIAYGTTTKKFSTSNITTVKADDIAKQPVNNPLLALEGRVPGMFIQQQSGVSGSNVKINIQGINSLGNGSDPFYVIDGVPYTAQFITSLANGAFNSTGGSTFNFVNPADIESITVLKDADATAIYGSRGANGAILITTKKGKAGKTKVDVNAQNGWGQVDHKLNFLNTQQYLEMRKEAYTNAGQAIPNSATSPNSGNYDLTVWDQNRYTDWQKVLVGNTAHFTDIQASVSGGSNTTQFLVGYGYNRQTTVYSDNLADIKGNVHLNLNHNSQDNKLHYNISATYLVDKNTLGAGDLMEKATKLAPNAPALYNSDGTLNWERFPENPLKYSFNNPLAYTESRYTGNTNSITANNTISYEIIPGLEVKAAMGFNRISGNEIQINPLTSIRPDFYSLTTSANYLNKNITSWSIEPQIIYTKETKFGVIDAVLGSSLQRVSNDLLSQTGTGYNSDAQLGDISAASSIAINNNIKSLYKYNALFGRLNYRLANKYILNLTARRDGSSRFGDENKLNTFYSVGGAWLFGDEDLIKNHLPWLSTGKLKASYGTTGNDQITDYRYLSLLNNYNVDIPYGQSVGLTQSSIANPFLQWEETRKINIGMDLGFLKDRVLLSINYYRNRSSNQLIGYVLPAITGFYAVDQNFPATVQNKGLEAQLDISLIKNSDFNWHSSFNISFQRNKLIVFPGLATSSYADQYIIGQPINIIKAYKFAGVNPTTGLYQVIDHNGKTTSNPDPTTDRTVLIDPNPKFYGGFSNSLQYKSFSLDFIFQFVNQKAPNYKFGNIAGSDILNQPTSILNRWRKPGDVADIQKVTTNFFEIYTPYNAATASDAAYVGGSYIRLKNASLSYSLPSMWLNRIRASRARVYVQGQNLLTFTNFTGSDPETQGIGILPPLKIITVGLQITF